MTTSDIITERNKTHGSFDLNAQISQDIKAIIRASPGWDSLNYKQKESLDVIALKISRVLSGRAEHADHWDDIIGYARLARGDQPQTGDHNGVGIASAKCDDMDRPRRGKNRRGKGQRVRA